MMMVNKKSGLRSRRGEGDAWVFHMEVFGEDAEIRRGEQQ
jgi:hypothetical protein